jgi:hypothetical protein
MTHATNQYWLPLRGPTVAVDLADVQKQPSGAASISLCATKSGKLDKILAADIGAQEAVWSRIQTTGKGFSLEQLSLLMDSCGNEAPLQWLLLLRGYDPRSLRKLETETERKLRESEETLARERAERAALEQAMRRMLTGAPA